ncbi:methyltransferase domain-containing protein [Rossellomorea vietnamensis]|uniref:Methyltransferase domain-containing protein n=1 Tax=Rossellomorea vietnamensis TaxID=218284 RepID=A0A5D4NYN8_9BACI|nr:class I SAM-dependent methyltransferase [Rossellomorea vietnamensis]TYS18861.1 methyltransferase domain-containing protein [Rossellomorea vietnamensis]
MKKNEWHESAQERWNNNASNWHSRSVNMWTEGSRKEIIPFMVKHLAEGSKVADLGCGDGFGSYLLYEKGYKVTGMDLSEKMVEIAKKQEKDRLSFIQGDLSNPPFEKEEFDAVMMINSLEWTENPLHALKEVKGLVKQNGMLCIGILGPTAHPRENSFPRLYGEKVICNTMMPWELEKLALDSGMVKDDEKWIYKQGVPEKHLMNLSSELKQALSFMTLFMFRIQDN